MIDFVRRLFKRSVSLEKVIKLPMTETMPYRNSSFLLENIDVMIKEASRFQIIELLKEELEDVNLNPLLNSVYYRFNGLLFRVTKSVLGNGFYLSIYDEDSQKLLACDALSFQNEASGTAKEFLSGKLMDKKSLYYLYPGSATSRFVQQTLLDLKEKIHQSKIEEFEQLELKYAKKIIR